MTSILRRVLGRPADWHLRRPRTPRFSLPRPRLAWVGPIAVLASIAVSWTAFAGARGEGSVALGLFLGAASIMLMAWSFMLALRPRVLEPFFGGLDSMYRVHRWAGSLAVPLMFFHIQIEPEIKGGILGASRAVAEGAEDLAGTGELLLYVLIGLSLLRWIPYRWWRWTHKLLGVPFALACWHFFTAEKTYANTSGWGWWFNAFMLAGLGGWLARILWRDAVSQGKRYKVADATVAGTNTTLELAPRRKSIDFEAGQFAFMKLQVPGMKEPHAFTIASSPSSPNLRFVIRELGDWSARLRTAVLEGKVEGAEVLVEGPYGRFVPFGHDDQQTVWIAGGVGVTPFLAAIDQLRHDRSAGGSTASTAIGSVPHMLYAVRYADESPIVSELQAAADDGLIHLSVFESSTGNRLAPSDLVEVVGADIVGAHVALCGPQQMVSDMEAAARAAGAAETETEDFDMRQGFGPDLSKDIDDAVRSVVASRRGGDDPVPAYVGELVESTDDDEAREPVV